MEKSSFTFKPELIFLCVSAAVGLAGCDISPEDHHSQVQTSFNVEINLVEVTTKTPRLYPESDSESFGDRGALL